MVSSRLNGLNTLTTWVGIIMKCRILEKEGATDEDYEKILPDVWEAVKRKLPGVVLTDYHPKEGSGKKKRRLAGEAKKKEADESRREAARIKRETRKAERDRRQREWETQHQGPETPTQEMADVDTPTAS